MLMAYVYSTTNESDTSMRSVGNFLTNSVIFENMRENAASLNIEKLMAYSRYFNATDGRDRLYALLGLWTQSLTYKKEMEYIVPAYESVNVEGVFTQASWAIIREMEDLNILCQVEDHSIRKERNLPSWVPDYSVTPEAHFLLGNPRPVPGKERWKAGGRLRWSPTLIADHEQKQPSIQRLQTCKILPVEGIRLDTVTEVAATQEEIVDEYALESLLQLVSNALKHQSKSGDIRISNLKIEDGTDDAHIPYPLEAFWRSLIKDTFNGEPADDKARAAFNLFIVLRVWELETALANLRNASDPSHKAETPPISPDPNIDPNFEPFPGPKRDPTLSELEIMYAQSKALVLELSKFAISDIATTEAYPGMFNGVVPHWETVQHLITSIGGGEAGEELDTATDLIGEAFDTAYAGRRLFRTEKHNHLGIAARSLIPGDELWVLAGVDVPMVLRHVDQSKKGSTGINEDRRKLVGEAYVWGLDGWRGCAKDGRESESDRRIYRDAEDILRMTQ